MRNFNKEEIVEKIIEKLKTIKDLELPINIYDLGLIYKIDLELKEDNVYATIEMTVINSRCNSTKSFTDEIIALIKTIDEIDDCNIKFVFSPKWDVKMISEEGLEQLRNSNSN